MVSIGPKIQITGETAYRQALNRIISETKSLNSEMDLMVAKFNKSDTAIEKNKQKQEMLTRQIQQSWKQYDSFRDVLDRATQKFNDANKKYDESKQKLDALRAEQERVITSMANLEKNGGRNTQAFKDLEKQLENVNKDIKDTEEATEGYSNEITRSGKVMADWQTQVNKAGTELANLQNELRDIPSSLETVGSKMQEVGNKIAGVGESLTMYITTPLVAAGTAFVKWSSDFTDGLAKVYTIAEESQVPMSQMRQELIELSNSTGFSLEDLAEAEYQAVSASVATADSVAFLDQATKLARAGFTSTTKSVDVLSTVMNSYGKEAYDVSYISDVLLKTQNDGKVVVDQLAQGLGTIIPLASAYNVGLEDVSAALATMTKQGVPASKAITFLRAAFTELEKDGSDVNNLLWDLEGKTFAQLMDSGMSLADVLQILYNAVDQDEESFARLFGNVRSSQATVTLLKDNFSILRSEIDKMYDAAGQTAKALEVLETPSLKAKRAIQQLKNSGMELGTTLINELYPYFLQVIDGIKKLTDWFAGLDEGTKNTIVNFGLMVAAAPPLITAFGKLVSGAGGMLSALGKLPQAMSIYNDWVWKATEFTAGFSGGAGNLVAMIGTALPWVVGFGAAFTAIGAATEYAMEKHREEITAIWGLDEKMKEHIETSKEAELAYVDMKNAAMEDVIAKREQADVAQNLIDKYNDLIDSNGEVRKGHEDLADIYLNQLAEALGMEVDQIKTLIEENGKFGESIQKTIDDIIRRAEVAAYEEILTESIKRQTQAELELEKQENDLVVQQSRVKQAQEATKEAYEAMIEAQKRGDPEIARYEQAWRDAVEAESQATAAEKELRDAIDLTKTRVTAAEQDAQNARRKIKETTEGTMADTTNAIKTGGDSAVREAKNVADKIEAGFSVDGDNLGYNFNKGLADGIDRYGYLARAAAARVASSTSGAARGALSIQSPSKVMAEVGKYFDEGFAKGIVDNMREVAQSANLLAQTAVNGAEMMDYGFGNTYRTVSAPITITLNVEGNVDGDDRAFTRNIAEELANLITRESEVFA